MHTLKREEPEDREKHPSEPAVGHHMGYPPFYTRSQALKPAQQELPIPIVRDLDYTEVEWAKHAPNREAIVPGLRVDPPKMGMLSFIYSVFFLIIIMIATTTATTTTIIIIII